MEEFLKDDERRWKKQSPRVGVMDGQAGQLNQELIMLLLKFQIPRLGEWLIAQGYINCLEKNQWLCTFRLCENIYSYMWKHRFGKGGVEESKRLASCSSCHKVKSHAPSKQRDKNELFYQVARLHRGPLH